MATEKTASASEGILLGIHLDIGHSSIGWAVTQSILPPVFVGCGTLLFPKDACLASERRANRRQRRHIRSTRQRIARLRHLLRHTGALTEEELNLPGCGWPWKLAAEAIGGQRILSWPEMWGVLRWYAHNRGYDGNILWQRRTDSVKEDKETRESVDNALNLMRSHKTSSMAATVCAVMGVAPGDGKCASMIRFKKARASFPRDVVRSEITKILHLHLNRLPHLDEALITAIVGSPADDPDAWQAVPCPAIKLPRRYAGGLLFGQLIPRFDNRIIGSCPVGGEKKPLKSCPEFLEYRWAMQLANVRVRRIDDKILRPLLPAERIAITAELRRQGYFTRSSFKKAVSEATKAHEDNLDDMLLHPDAEQALVLYPAIREIRSRDLAFFWDVLPPKVQSHITKRLAKGKALTLRDIRALSSESEAFEQKLSEFEKKNSKKKADILDRAFKADFPAGRAPYGRNVMRQAVSEVMAGKDPRAEGGVLYAASKAKALNELAIDRETNNHLVRNRLRIMRRLVEEIVVQYAAGDKARIEAITIELNRDVKELSGQTAKQIAQDLGLRLKNHTAAVEYAAEKLQVPAHKLGGALIRKVRIAMDLQWKCPYTMMEYDIHQLRGGAVDLDHVIPYSKRASDSLDSLVITFKAVNAWKSNSTAMDFIHSNAGLPVPGMPNLSVVSPKRYEEFVADLKKTRLPHPDDQRRRDNRCKRMLTRFSDDCAEKGFTPRDLTVSSHLVTLAAAVLRDVFAGQPNPPYINSVPGRITKHVRMSCEIMGVLASVNPLVVDSDGHLKTKTEIRDITHLHHAVDAVTLGLATTLVPVNGEIWALMLKRNLTPYEQRQLLKTKAFRSDDCGRVCLKALDVETLQSIKKCIMECRVATHQPARRHGAALEKNTWRIVARDGDSVTIRQRTRDEKTGTISTKTEIVNSKRLLGIDPKGASKLKSIKGGIIISENYGVALDPIPEVIPYHHVWRRIGEIKKRNNGVMPRIIRNGMLIRVRNGKNAGIWKVFSVKHAQVGILLDIGKPDVVRLENKTEGHRINVRLAAIARDGLELPVACLTGTPCHVAPSD